MITQARIRETVADAVTKAGVLLPEDVSSALAEAYRAEGEGSVGKRVLGRILENLEAADACSLPLCQDTGMVLVFADIGTGVSADLANLNQAVEEGIVIAYRDNFFRKSIVKEPVFERENTGSNIPAVIYHTLVPGSDLTLHIVLKGFGSENCSALAMLNPTAGPEGVIEAVVRMVRDAGGKPCPPVVVGVGIGGTADRALQLSKRALLRDLTDRNPDNRYAHLEDQLLQAVNELHIGPGGLGGTVTALAVKTAAEATHIAGMPVGVSISCWADRKVSIILRDAEAETADAETAGRETAGRDTAGTPGVYDADAIRS